MNIPQEFVPFWPLRGMSVEHPDFPLEERKMVTEYVVEPRQFRHHAKVARVGGDWSEITPSGSWGRVQTTMEALMVFDGEISPERLTHRILISAVLGEGPLPHGYLAMVAVNQVQILPRSEREYAPARGEYWEVTHLKMPWVKPRGGYDYKSVDVGTTTRGKPLLKAYVEAHEARFAVRDGV